MSKKEASMLIPSGKEFLSNKNISDRVYVWILLNGERNGLDTYIDKKPRNAYKQIGIQYRTFYKRLDNLVENGYLEDCEYSYRVITNNSEYGRLIYKNTIQQLYNTGLDNIIKVYVYLGSLYSAYKTDAYFTLQKLSNEVGYLSQKSSEVNKKIKEILNKLSELGLVRYCKDTSMSERYHVKYKILEVK